MLKENVEKYFRKDDETRDKLSKDQHIDLLNKRIDILRWILREIIDWADRIEDIKVLQKER